MLPGKEFSCTALQIVASFTDNKGQRQCPRLPHHNRPQIGLASQSLLQWSTWQARRRSLHTLPRFNPDDLKVTYPRTARCRCRDRRDRRGHFHHKTQHTHTHTHTNKAASTTYPYLKFSPTQHFPSLLDTYLYLPLFSTPCTLAHTSYSSLSRCSTSLHPNSLLTYPFSPIPGSFDTWEKEAIFLMQATRWKPPHLWSVSPREARQVWSNERAVHSPQQQTHRRETERWSSPPPQPHEFPMSSQSSPGSLRTSLRSYRIIVNSRAAKISLQFLLLFFGVLFWPLKTVRSGVLCWGSHKVICPQMGPILLVTSQFIKFFHMQFFSPPFPPLPTPLPTTTFSFLLSIIL